MVPRMRPADIAECEASGHPNLLWTVKMSITMSSHCWTATVDGEVACIFGVGAVSLLGGQGCPWLLGTDHIDRNARVFIRRSVPYIHKMLEAYPHLLNFVDARNVRSIRWLRQVGFTVHDPVPHGPFHLPFHPFERRA